MAATAYERELSQGRPIGPKKQKIFSLLDRRRVIFEGTTGFADGMSLAMSSAAAGAT
jgi:hypothetical protein